MSGNKLRKSDSTPDSLRLGLFGEEAPSDYVGIRVMKGYASLATITEYEDEPGGELIVLVGKIKKIEAFTFDDDNLMRDVGLYNVIRHFGLEENSDYEIECICFDYDSFYDYEDRADLVIIRRNGDIVIYIGFFEEKEIVKLVITDVIKIHEYEYSSNSPEDFEESFSKLCNKVEESARKILEGMRIAEDEIDAYISTMNCAISLAVDVFDNNHVF